MTAMPKFADFIELGEATTYRNLSVTPIFLKEGAPEGPNIKTLDEAIDEGFFTITEVSEDGVVAEVLATNKGEDPVLILQGEEIKGAKQNRTANISVVVPAQSALVLPVSCIEQGRWATTTSSFSSAGRVHSSAMRARKAAYVSRNRKLRESYATDQHMVWEHASDELRLAQAESPTKALSEAYEKQQDHIEHYTDAFVPQQKQLGAIYRVDGKIIGMDLLGSPAVFAKSYKKLMQGSAFQAITTSSNSGIDEASNDYVEQVQRSKVDVYESIGVGEEYHIDDERLTGAALFGKNTIVHGYAFPKFPDA